MGSEWSRLERTMKGLEARYEKESKKGAALDAVRTMKKARRVEARMEEIRKARARGQTGAGA